MWEEIIMKLTEAKKLEWEKTLKEINLIEAADSIEEHTQGDLWSFGSQSRGNFFFTKEKFVFVSGFGLNNFAINYSDIKGLKKSMINFFIPTGITVTALDPEKGKTKKYKCSVMKRKDWMAYLSQRAGITL